MLDGVGFEGWDDDDSMGDVLANDNPHPFATRVERARGVCWQIHQDLIVQRREQLQALKSKPRSRVPPCRSAGIACCRVWSDLQMKNMKRRLRKIQGAC